MRSGLAGLVAELAEVGSVYQTGLEVVAVDSDGVWYRLTRIDYGRAPGGFTDSEKQDPNFIFKKPVPHGPRAAIIRIEKLPNQDPEPMEPEDPFADEVGDEPFDAREKTEQREKGAKLKAGLLKAGVISKPPKWRTDPKSPWYEEPKPKVEKSTKPKFSVPKR